MLTLYWICVGANCIFPLLGNTIYHWNFICSEVSDASIKHAQHLITLNALTEHIRIRKQVDSKHILDGIIEEKDKIDISICNPPFFSCKEDKTLPNPKSICPITDSEECCEGGELGFICRYICESADYSKNVAWFTTLVGRKMDVESIVTYISELNTPAKHYTETFHQGRNRRWGVAWSFKLDEQNKKKKKVSS